MPKDDKELIEVLESFWTKKLKTMHGAFPAKIESYDQITGLASIKNCFQLKFKGEVLIAESMPTIQDVPVVWQRTTGSIQFAPLKIGDIGLGVCTERSMSDWVAGKGDPNFPEDPRQFNLSDAYFIPGGYPMLEPSNLKLPLIPKNAIGTLVDQGVKMSWGSRLPVSLITGSPTIAELVNLVSKLCEYIGKLNLAHSGAGTAPVPEISTDQPLVQAAIDGFKV